MRELRILDCERTKLVDIKDKFTQEVVDQAILYGGDFFYLSNFSRIDETEEVLLKVGNYILETDDGRILILGTFVSTIQCMIFTVDVEESTCISSALIE